MADDHLASVPTIEEGPHPGPIHGATTVDMAANATDAEHRMSLLEGIRTYPKAMAWSVLLSATIIMEGFDNVLTGQFYALPQFKRKFGEEQPDGSFEIPAAWQAGLSNGVLVGSLIGISIAGWAAERFGYRRTMMVELCVTIGVVFIYFFAQNIQTLLGAAVLMGIPFGGYETLTTSYAAEVMPTSLRSYLTTYVNLCWVIGQMAASGTLRGALSLPGDLAFRIPYALQWLLPVPLLVGLFFAPESPWWLVRHERIEDARKALRRLTSVHKDAHFNSDETIAMMKRTITIEKAQSEGTSFVDCFRGINRRRTEITCLVWASQGLCGSAFIGYSAYLFQQIGLSNEQSYTLTLVQYGLGFIGTVTSWAAMSYLGRRTLYLGGFGVVLSLLLAIGSTGLATANSTNEAASWAIGAMNLVYVFVYNVAIGAICYSLVSEMPSVRLRIKTVALARGAYNLVGVFNFSVTPYMLNPTAWNWGARSTLFWAGLTALCGVWIFFRLPEPKGLTYGELDELFHHKVPARRFKKIRNEAREMDVAIKLHLTQTCAEAEDKERFDQWSGSS